MAIWAFGHISKLILGPEIHILKFLVSQSGQIKKMPIFYKKGHISATFWSSEVPNIKFFSSHYPL